MSMFVPWRKSEMDATYVTAPRETEGRGVWVDWPAADVL
jgi:hypothetical protein